MSEFCFVIFILLFVGISLYSQDDYVIVMERIEVVSFNKQHLSVAKAHNSKYNRTHIGTTFTFGMKTDFGDNLKMAVQAYRFASNEYRLFPMTFTIDLCSSLERNEFGACNIYNCGNFSRCPMKRGYYVLCNWAPDYSKFPPYMPHGSYKLQIRAVYHSIDITCMEVFGTVKGVDNNY